MYRMVEPGPLLIVGATVPGDEIIGIDIIRRLLQLRKFKPLRGTLLAVPIVDGMGAVIAELRSDNYLSVILCKLVLGNEIRYLHLFQH